ncbi:alpha-L-fucosidase [Planctomycetota bacterium]
MAKMAKQYLAIILAATIIFVAAAQTKAQENVKLPNKLRLRTERTTHPDAQWFPDAGLGLFIHYDPSCLHHASVWTCFLFEEKPGWMKADFRSPTEYFELADKWNPEKYDPDKWMKAAKSAGFKYAVLTARQHIGYAIWPSQYGEMSTRQYMNGRDLIRPYVEACRKNDLKVGFYYSGPDWYYEREYINFYFGKSEEEPVKRDNYFINYKHERVDNLPKRTPQWRQQFREFRRGQIFELLNNYGNIDIWWWDGGGSVTAEEMRKINPGIIINNRGGGGDFVTPECQEHFKYEYIKEARKNGWWIELCEIWPYGLWNYGDPKVSEELKDTGWLLYLLAKCRCWDCNLLLDVGPRPDGQMPQQFYDKCTEMAEWMKHSGESVFGITGGGPYPEKSNVPITIKKNIWYLHPDYRRETWDEPIVVQDVEKPVAVKLLRTGEPLNYTYNDQTLTILIPKSKRTDLTDVVAVQFQQ